MTLEGLDGNAFFLMGAFSREARKSGWSQEEIKEVTDKCMSGDYDNLLCTLMEHTEDPEDSNDFDYDDDESW